MSKDDATKTLTDAEIITAHPGKTTAGRRGFLGLMAAGGVGAAFAPRMAEAQGRDGDTGAWTDGAGCQRGPAGSGSSGTDADSGAISDPSGRGRGAPRC